MWIEVKDITGTRRLVNTNRVTDFVEGTAPDTTYLLRHENKILIAEPYESIRKKLLGFRHDNTGERLRKREEFFKGK